MQFNKTNVRTKHIFSIFLYASNLIYLKTINFLRLPSKVRVVTLATRDTNFVAFC